ncbi:MAG: hypothetical protein V4734_02580, partial [Terriglobus sp.]
WQSIVLLVWPSDARHRGNPFHPTTLDGFGDGVAHLVEPIDTAKDKGHGDLLSGGLHGPRLLSTMLRLTRFTEKMFVSVQHGSVLSWEW